MNSMYLIETKVVESCQAIVTLASQRNTTALTSFRNIFNRDTVGHDYKGSMG